MQVARVPASRNVGFRAQRLSPSRPNEARTSRFGASSVSAKNSRLIGRLSVRETAPAASEPPPRARTLVTDPQPAAWGATSAIPRAHGYNRANPPRTIRASPEGARPPMTETATTERPHAAAKRYIYAWGGGHAEGSAAMRDLLGGKGAGLAEMTSAGLPVPPGFTITTEACNDYFAAGERLPDGLWQDVLDAVKEVEKLTGKGFGDPANPLLVSVRSGAKFSMPGMMDTVLNLGLNEHTLHGLIALTSNERFGWDAYRRFIQMFGRIVMGVDGEKFDAALDHAKATYGAKQDTDLEAAALREV